MAEILRPPNEAEDPATARREVQELLRSVSAADPSRAEQQLIEAGTRPEELRRLADSRTGAMGEHNILPTLTLRHHILDENGILYPTALEVIDGEVVWEKMEQDCCRIGLIPVSPRA